MARVKKTQPEPSRKTIRPATTPEAREQQMIALAVDLAERQLLDGTASSQVITHYLKLGSMRERLERERLEEENKLLRAKTKDLEDKANYNVLVENAINAMRNYSGQGDADDYQTY